MLFHAGERLSYRHALHANGTRHRPSRSRSSVVSARIVRIGDVSSQAVVPRWRTSVVSARITRKRDSSQAFTTTILCCLGTHCTHRGCLVTGLHDHDPLLSRHALYANGTCHRPSRLRSSVVSARIVRKRDLSQAFTTTILCLPSHLP